MKTEKIVNYISYDGMKLEGILCLPNSDFQHIAILVHGIMSDKDELGLYSGLANHLAKENIASIRFDYRGHGNSAVNISEITLAGIVNDIQATYNFVVEKYDGKIVNAIGMSFGGGLTGYWASQTSDKINSVTMLAPVIDYQEDILGQHGLMNGNKLSSPAIELLTKQGFLETDGIKYCSWLLNEIPYINGIIGLKNLKCRSLIIHGDSDSIVPFSLSKKFVNLNQRSKLINIPGTDHGFGIPGDEDLIWKETKLKQAEVYSYISQFILE